ncbi:MAG: DUF4393 domain-containing protein [Hydrogenophaga sp.]|nr:DUF4393 domain-containing protein [Hydrogenophaga sp.]
MNESESVTEAAKAVQEVAKTTGKAIEVSEKFGGFISKFVTGSLEQAVGIFEDKLKYMRWERQVRYMQRVEQLARDVGLSSPTRVIPLKLAIPLLEAASLEDDDLLQDLWVRLLVNAVDERSHINLQRSYIEILRQLTSLEAKLLQMIYSLPYEQTLHAGIVTGGLPTHVVAHEDDGRDHDPMEPSIEVKLALANLARLGFVVVQKSWGGGEIFKKVNPTLLGMSFVQACTMSSVS